MFFKLLTGTCVFVLVLLFEVYYVFTSFSFSMKYLIYRVEGAFFLTFVFFEISKYLWKKVVEEVLTRENPKYVQYLWKGLVLTFLVLSLICPFTSILIGREPTKLNMVAWTCLGAYLFLLFTYLFTGVLVTFLTNILHWTPVSKRAHALFAVAFTAICTSLAFITAVQTPQITSVEIPIVKLPPSMDNLKIALLCDVHLGPTVGFTQLQRIVKLTNQLNPDIVVFAGDLMDASVKELDGAASPLAELWAPYGKYFVTGNHEYITNDITNWFEILQVYGFTILHNSNRKIYSHKNQKDWFCMIGTDDIVANQIRYKGHGMNLPLAYKGCDTSHASILIAHQPKAAKMALDSDFSIQLVLSGHTHGGQMYPFLWLVYLFNPYLSGLYKHGAESYVYVSQGSVYYGFPLRWGTYPEITNITLRAA